MRSSCSKRLGQQLPVVRELPVDQPRGQDHAAEREQHLVLADADAQLLVLGVGHDARQLLERPRRHVDLERRRQRRLERRLLDAQPVGVGRDHPQLAVGGRDEDPGQHRPRLVARGRAGDLQRGRRRTRRPGSATAELGVGLGERREVLGAQRADVERGVARDELDVLLGGPQLERDGLGRQRAHDVEQQPRREHDDALAGDLGLERDAQADVHVGGAQLAADSGAGSWTPDSAWIALRVEATLLTVCSCASRASRSREIFTMNTSKGM